MQERGEAINTTQRPDEQDPAAALDTLPDDLLLHIVVACGGEWLLGVPELHGRGERSWQPVHRCLGAALIGYIPSCTGGSTASPQQWSASLVARGDACCCTRASQRRHLVDVVVDEARRGHVRSIDARRTTLTPAVAKRVVPELLGVGCSLLDLKLEGLQLGVGLVEHGNVWRGSGVQHGAA